MNNGVLLIVGLFLMGTLLSKKVTNGTDKMKLAEYNNNPLNIKFSKTNNWQGQIASKSGAFVYFTNKDYGYRAAFVLLKNYVAKGFDTIDKVINRWAPFDDDNDTPAYIAFVEKETGINRHKKLNHADFKKVIAAMARMESGDRDEIAQKIGFGLAFGNVG